MMETHPLIFGRDEGIREGELRVPAWPDLAARLAATRDLRGAFHADRGSEGGSFSRFMAGDREPLNVIDASVNPTGLADGKGTGRKDAVSNAGEAPADREMR